jgi:hypothetical protein
VKPFEFDASIYHVLMKLYGSAGRGSAGIEMEADVHACASPLRQGLRKSPSDLVGSQDEGLQANAPLSGSNR